MNTTTCFHSIHSTKIQRNIENLVEFIQRKSLYPLRRSFNVLSFDNLKLISPTLRQMLYVHPILETDRSIWKNGRRSHRPVTADRTLIWVRLVIDSPDCDLVLLLLDNSSTFQCA